MEIRIIAITLLVIGIGLRYWINRRRFNRRNAFGMEGFSSFERAGMTILGERLIKFVGMILIAFGLFLLGITFIPTPHYHK